ncbi:MAG: hypothetical protein M0R77_02590 [Gammaproteobacteria bacterium]|nr:hypothetical protein [Gammaproteobacteria bacterium]
MVGDGDINYLSGKLDALAELQAIMFGIRMKTIDNDPESIKSALKQAKDKSKNIRGIRRQIGYDEVIDTALNKSPADLMEW